METKKTISDLNLAIEKYGFAIGTYRFFRKPIKMRIPFIGDLCDVSIDELALSVRGYNVLMRNNIKTAGEVIDIINENKLDSLRNLGTKTSIEIKSKIIDYGFNALSDKKKKILIETLYNDNI